MSKLNLFLLFAFLSFSTVTYSQNQQKSENANIAPSTGKEIYTPLKPQDATPYQFSSKEDLAQGVPVKKEKILSMIRENESDPAKVKLYREELWRLENAIIVEPK